MKIAIIGAGPAGVMAAIAAKKSGAEITLYDKNEKIGKKLYITGKGRCNVTNASDISEFFDRIINNPSFLYSSFYGFTNEDLMALLRETGLPLKVERGDRVFPQSDKSSDVLKTLIKLVKGPGVEVTLSTSIKAVTKTERGFRLETSRGVADYDRLVIATGGLSYPVTGSTGDGYAFARAFGHTVTALSPSLVGVIVKDSWVGEWEGVSLKNVELVLKRENKVVGAEFGEMVFTREGLSGPIVLTLSTLIRGGIIDKHLTFLLDLKPAVPFKDLDERLLRELGASPNAAIKTIFEKWTVKRLIPRLFTLAGVAGNTVANQLSKEDRQRLIRTLKGISFDFQALRPINEAIITAGGVSVDEVDPSTMESKLVKGLYFAGEVLDLDAETGGYNLQIAFSTGYAAGSGAGNA